MGKDDRRRAIQLPNQAALLLFSLHIGASMRFSDDDTTFAEQLDFVPRARASDLGLLAVGFATVLLIVLLAAYGQALHQNAVFLSVFTVVAVLVLCLYTVYHKQRSQDLVMATEYQNMLFSQALNLGNSFCLFVKRDGTVVYASESMKNIFPAYQYAESQALATVLDQGALLVEDRERILGAIRSGSADHMLFPLADARGSVKHYILTVEPLARPGGFLLLRGREYFGKRTGAQVLPDMLRATSVDKLDHLLTTTPAALYTTDMYGRIEFANPMFERLLGYAPGQIMAQHLSLHHLLFSVAGEVITEEYVPTGYEGEARAVRRDGERLPVHLSQSLLRDAQGKPVGATGTLLALAG